MNSEVLENDFLKIEVKAHGAELASVYSKELRKELLWNADEKVWSRHAPVLFPFVGKLRNNQYEYENQIYQMPQHGFARDLEHENIDRGAFLLTYTNETLKKFPFKFSLETKYILEGCKVFVHYLVKNLDSKKLYFSLGAHPGFKIIDGKNVIVFEKNEEFYLLESGLINFEKSNSLKHLELLLQKDTFSNDALIFKNLNSHSISLVNEIYKIKMKIDHLPFFGLWGKENQFVCLEPWWGIADTIANNGRLIDKAGIRSINPNEEEKLSYSFELEVIK